VKPLLNIFSLSLDGRGKGEGDKNIRGVLEGFALSAANGVR